MSFRFCSSLPCALLALLGGLDRVGAQDTPADRLARFLPLGEAPPFVQKIEKGVRREQAAPEGEVPPRDVVQANAKGEAMGEAFKLQLNRLGAFVPISAGQVRLHRVEDGGAGPQPWHQLVVPSADPHALILLWRDPATKNWSAARSMVLPDGKNSFAPGVVRLTNLSPWPAAVRLGDKSYEVQPARSVRVRRGALQQVALRVVVRDRNGKSVVVYNSAVSQGSGERSNVIIYRADGVRPRRPAKVHVFREEVRLPPPPRPREG